MTQLSLSFSVRMLVEDTLGIPAIILYGGITLPTDKPFATIRQLNNVSTGISKAREAVSTNFGFRISLRCESLAQRSEFQDRLRDALLFGEHPLYDNLANLTGSTFEDELEGENVLNVEDVTNISEFHQAHFDIGITKIRHKNRGNN